MKKLAVLISNKGTGTNLQAIIDAIENKKINAKIALVVSDTEEAKGLERARKHNLPIAINKKKENLAQILKKAKIDFVCLGGWKQIITSDVIDAFPNKILNVHPGLVPDTIDGEIKNPDGTKALWNKGKLTDNAMKNFLENKATYGGASIHLLTHEFDFGPVLGRAFVKILPDDTIDSLYDRIKKEEHKMYIKALKKLCK